MGRGWSQDAGGIARYTHLNPKQTEKLQHAPQHAPVLLESEKSLSA
jgi:hypothetical protein